MIRSVTTGYFAASGSILKAGRFFTDNEQAQVGLISESLAMRLWPREAPTAVVGRRMPGSCPWTADRDSRCRGRCPARCGRFAKTVPVVYRPTVSGRADLKPMVMRNSRGNLPPLLRVHTCRDQEVDTNLFLFPRSVLCAGSVSPPRVHGGELQLMLTSFVFLSRTPVGRSRGSTEM